MNNFHSEEHPTDKLAVSTLKNVSTQLAIPYSKLKKIFTEGDEEIAKYFWITLRKTLPNHKYNAVYCCPSCKKFDIEREGNTVLPW
jgi:hypothetical protein